MDRSLDSRWTLMWVKLGALCWLLQAVLYFAGYAPFGPIELWFLLAPLVVVPLGFELLLLTESRVGIIRCVISEFQHVGGSFLINLYDVWGD